MKVMEAEDGVRIEPDHVYVIPPNKDKAIYHGVLQLTMFVEPRGSRMPIDFFFRSLAEDQGERAIGVIFSAVAILYITTSALVVSIRVFVALNNVDPPHRDRASARCDSLRGPRGANVRTRQ